MCSSRYTKSVPSSSMLLGSNLQCMHVHACWSASLWKSCLQVKTEQAVQTSAGRVKTGLTMGHGNVLLLGVATREGYRAEWVIT